MQPGPTLVYCPANVITNIHIDNFKSLKGIDITGLPALSYFCGPNASGKSNFAEAFDFMSNAFRNGLSYAVAEKGGFYNICFRKQRRARGSIAFQIKGNVSAGESPRGTYAYEIAFSLRTREEAIRSDFFLETERYRFSFSNPEHPPFTVSVEREEDRYAYRFEGPEPLPQEIIRTIPWVREGERVFTEFIKPRPNELLYPVTIQNLLPFHPVMLEPSGIRVFRIGPRSARQAGTPSVLGELGKYGDNLPSAIDYMSTKDGKAFKQLQKWVKEVIPGISHLETDYTETKQMGLFLQEKGFGHDWYADDLSDGTLMSIALFLALLDSRHTLVVIEEPENCLHPWILRRFLDSCKEVSQRKQILITTQSPLVVATAQPENLYLVERKRGITQIGNALEKDPTLAQIAREKFLDLGEYWLSGGLGAVPAPPESDDAPPSDEDE